MSEENNFKGVDKIKGLYEKAQDGLTAAKDKIVSAVDVNGNGEIDIVDIIVAAFKTPGVHINREKFLRKELFKNHTPEEIDKAIATTPALAGIKPEEIDALANETINFERAFVSGISAALGAPGGWAIAATVPADLIQYYGYTLRAAQKMLYLYGFPDIDMDSQDGLQLDSATINQLILCLGIMNGAAGANNAIKAIAKALANGVEKQLLKMALAKGALYPFLKSFLKWFGINLTKKIFASSVKNAIPVVGGLVGGGLTFAMFKPCCNRLKNVLSDTLLSNPKHTSTAEENEIYEDIKTGSIHVVDDGDFIIIPDSESEEFDLEEQ